MNIFLLDYDHRECARAHCNKHVVKMILETAQLLCTAHWETGGSARYKSTHKNHPCSVWVRKSLTNYKWLAKLGIELCHEYTHRYEKVHKTQEVIEWCIENMPEIPDVGLTEFAVAMPIEYKRIDAVDSYREYYRQAKRGIADWKRRSPPSWF